MGVQRDMLLLAMVAICLALCALGGFLTDLCLRRWARTGHAARRIRPYWLVPYAVLWLLPLAGALLPDSPVKFALQAAGNVWLGFFVYYGGVLLVLLGAAAFIRLASRGRLGRRWHGGILCLSLAAALALFGYGLVHAQDTVVVSHDLDVRKPVPGGEGEMKLVLVGDLHLGVNSRLATTERMVELINAQQPDVVVVAGDIFTSSYRGLAHPDDYAAALRGIESKYGVYAVYGNHDVEEALLGGFAVAPVSKAFRSREMEDFFAASGFVTLADEVVELPNGVQLAGRIDARKAGDGTNRRMAPDELLAGTDSGRPVLVLEHEPVEFAALAEAGADAVLCGHTHAGQIFPGNLIVPFLNENAWGYRRVNGVDTFVTAGVGCYGPPMRVGTDSEVTVINMRFKGGE